jgi:predicted alpha/beta hydrolase
MGVTQSYYSRFAEWLAARGYLAATFDYRGIGQSAPATLRGFDIDIRDWATQDCAAVIDFMKAQAPSRAVVLGRPQSRRPAARADPNRERIDRVDHDCNRQRLLAREQLADRRFVWWLWFVVVPLALRMAGYFPASGCAKSAILPRGVMAQWRRWCLDREYVVGVEGEGVRARTHRCARRCCRCHSRTTR